MKTGLRAMFVCLACFVAAATNAQTWPTKPVKIVAVFPPGGSVDTVARILSFQLTKQLGQQFVVDNKGGASARSAPQRRQVAADGYTFAVVFDTHAVNPSLIPGLPYDTLKDLAPVMIVGTSPMVIAKHPGAVQGLQGSDRAGQVKADAASFGSNRVGQPRASGDDADRRPGGTRFNHIPYKGGGPLVQDAIAGHVPLMIGTVFLAKPQIDAKMLVPLAVTSAKRSPRLPEVPTVAEQGVSGFESLAWWGVFAPGRHAARDHRPPQ